MFETDPQTHLLNFQTRLEVMGCTFSSNGALLTYGAPEPQQVFEQMLRLGLIYDEQWNRLNSTNGSRGTETSSNNTGYEDDAPSSPDMRLLKRILGNMGVRFDAEDRRTTWGSASDEMVRLCRVYDRIRQDWLDMRRVQGSEETAFVPMDYLGDTASNTRDVSTTATYNDNDDSNDNEDNNNDDEDDEDTSIIHHNATANQNEIIDLYTFLGVTRQEHHHPPHTPHHPSVTAPNLRNSPLNTRTQALSQQIHISWAETPHPREEQEKQEQDQENRPRGRNRLQKLRKQTKPREERGRYERLSSETGSSSVANSAQGGVLGAGEGKEKRTFLRMKSLRRAFG